MTLEFPPCTWEDAVLAPGATQMVHLKNLMLSRSYLNRVPDGEILPEVPPLLPVDTPIRHDALRAAYPQATRADDGSYGMVYFPTAEQSLRVDLGRLLRQVRAWWYDPRNGKAHPAGEYPNRNLIFTSPAAGPDWVPVLGDLSTDVLPQGIISLSV